MDCDKCNAYRDSLPAEQQAYWPCGYCPTGALVHPRNLTGSKASIHTRSFDERTTCKASLAQKR